eukprot:153432_1
MATKRTRNEVDDEAVEKESEPPTKKCKLNDVHRDACESQESSSIVVETATIHEFFNEYNNHCQMIDLRDMDEFKQSHVIHSLHFSDM